jgi:hypothetical protein
MSHNQWPPVAQWHAAEIMPAGATPPETSAGGEQVIVLLIGIAWTGGRSDNIINDVLCPEVVSVFGLVLIPLSSLASLSSMYQM